MAERDGFPPPVGRSAHGGELAPVHSSVGVILVDARTGDQSWCALVRGQDHDEVDKALAVMISGTVCRRAS
jgi:hypothetical protein